MPNRGTVNSSPTLPESQPPVPSSPVFPVVPALSLVLPPLRHSPVLSIPTNSPVFPTSQRVLQLLSAWQLPWLHLSCWWRNRGLEFRVTQLFFLIENIILSTAVSLQQCIPMLSALPARCSPAGSPSCPLCW